MGVFDLVLDSHRQRRSLPQSDYALAGLDANAVVGVVQIPMFLSGFLFMCGAIGFAISQKRLFWLQFRRHKLALASLAVLLFLALLVVLAPLIAPYPFDAIDTTQFRKPPSLSHIMGTDDIGRDLFTRLMVAEAKQATETILY